MLKKPCLKFQNRQHRFLEIFKAAVIQKPIFRSRPEEISPLTQFLIIFNNDDLRRKNSYQETGVHCPPLAGPLPLVSSADMQSWGTSPDDDNDVIVTVVVMVMMVVAVVIIMMLTCSSSAGVQPWGTNHDDDDDDEGDQEQEYGDDG